MSDAVCKCGHSERWHVGELAGGRFTQNLSCAAEGCNCRDFKGSRAA